MFDYFYGQSGEMFSYFRVPKILFRDIKFKDLSTDAKTLYGILLDRMGLSVKNGWLDEQGRVYIIFPVQEVMDALGCADNKATKLFRKLEKFGLIERKRRGLGKPNLIYVKNFADPRFRNREKNGSGAAIQRSRKRQNHDLRKSRRRACTGRQKGAAGGCRPAGVAYHSRFAPMASCVHCVQIYICPPCGHCHQHGLAAAQ